jgi:hypothetical protein
MRIDLLGASIPDSTTLVDVPCDGGALAPDFPSSGFVPYSRPPAAQAGGPRRTP